MKHRQVINYFGEINTIIMKNVHDMQIIALEHAFLMLFFLYKDKPLFSFLCLNKRKLIDMDKSYKFYQKAVHAFKKAVLSVQKIEDIFLLKIKTTEDNIDVLFNILEHIFKTYLNFRNYTQNRKI